MVFSFQYVFQKSKQCICIYTYIHTLHSIPLHSITLHSIPFHTIHTYIHIYIYVYTYINKSKQYKQSAIMVSHVHHIHQEFVKKKRGFSPPKKKQRPLPRRGRSSVPVPRRSNSGESPRNRKIQAKSPISMMKIWCYDHPIDGSIPKRIQKIVKLKSYYKIW